MNADLPRNDETQILGALAKGAAVTHYRVIEKIGAGGMGDVYLAEDIALNRRVALKFLHLVYASNNDLKARFRREAQATAALNHPNVVIIHEVNEYKGQPFFAMEYVGGGTLRDLIKSGECNPEQAFDLALHVSAGLQAAHAAGIIHRDIKPSNILITHTGQPKLVDFGLAAIRGADALTKMGTTMGTIAYMSPEQARSGEVDQRADIWALGVVLYEMLAGQLPFPGQHDQAMIYSILNQEPQPSRSLETSVPAPLRHLILKMMQKEPHDRPRDMAAVIADLESIRPHISPTTSLAGMTRETRPPSIAVLPFVDMSPQKDQEYFCDGMAEELINGLTKLEGFRVASRTSAFQFKSKDCDISEIGARLKVQTVLEGSVRKAGNRLRITAQLVNVADGYHLWSQKYDRDMEDIFAIQDEIAFAIVDTLKVKLLQDERVEMIGRPTGDLEAYNLYLRGRYFWNKRTKKGLEKGLKCFEQAIERDPQYAPAYAGLADSYLILLAFGSCASKQPLARARAAAERALALDETLAEAHTSLAHVRELEWDWSAAEAEYRRAIELNPGYATAHQWYGIYLAAVGRHAESIARGRRAQELDPVSPIVGVALGAMFSLAGQYDQAIRQLLTVLEMDPNFAAAHTNLGEAYLSKGNYAEAREEFRKAIALSPGDLSHIGPLGWAHAALGERDKALKILTELKEQCEKNRLPAHQVAALYAALGDKDQAFRWLEKSIGEKDYAVVFLKMDPQFSALRSDSRFQDLLKRIHLEA